MFTFCLVDRSARGVTFPLALDFNWGLGEKASEPVLAETPVVHVVSPG